MEDGGALQLIIILVLLVIMSAFFSASETAYSGLNPIRLKTRAGDGDKGAERALRLYESYDKLLSTILIGNNIVNILAASLATLLFTGWLGTRKGPAVSTIVLTIVVLIFGEITPKSLAKEFPEKFAIMSYPILNVLLVIFTPANFIFSKWKQLISSIFHIANVDIVTEDEVINLVEEAEDDGTFNETESELIRSAIEFDDLEVGSILTHRVDMVSVPDTVTLAQLADIFNESGYSRIPVYHENVDNIIGIVFEKDFYPAYLKGADKLSGLITNVEFTTTKTKISQLLHQLQSRRNHMAVVIDEFGGTQGIITLEDILEELVGEIWDEHDEVEEFCTKQEDGSYNIHGSMEMKDFADLFDLELSEDDDAVTVGGWVLSKIGRIPAEGYHLEAEGLDLLIARVSKRRIIKLVVRVLEPVAENA